MQFSDYPIVGSYNNQNISAIDCERTVNMFEYIDPDGKKPRTLISTSGLTNTNLDFDDAQDGFRGQFVFNGKSYFVIGIDIFVWDGILSPVKINNGFPLNTFEGYVGIDANTFQIIFVDGLDGYIYDTNSDVFTKITDTSFPDKPIDVCYLDGFFVVARGDTNQFQLSTYNQGLVWGVAVDTFTASESTDLLTLTSTANYQTGVPVTVTATDSGVAFTAANAGDLFTVASTTNYQNGNPVRFTGGSLPTGIVINTTYYIIGATGTTFQVSATFGGSAVVLSSDGSGTVIAQLPDPLVAGTTYYVINPSIPPATTGTTIKLATSYENAIAGTAINLLSNGGPTNEIRSQGQLQLGLVTSHPGTLVACRTLHRRIFFFCQNFTEVWENAGAGTNLPFRRNNALLMEVGTPSRWSVAVGFDKLFFLAQDRDGLSSVMLVDGTQGRPVSSRALDFEISQYAANQQLTVNDPSSTLIKQNGLIFYRLNFTLGNHTYVYNVSLSQGDNDLWHEEEVLNGDRHPAQTHMYFNGINYYGKYDEPVMYIVDPDNATNDGEAIKRMRIGRPIGDPTYKRIRIDRFHLDVVQGTVDNIPKNIAPIIFFSYSKDGGQTYGGRLQSTMGKIGERSFRTVWRKLGVVPRGQFFIPKIEFFNKIKFTVLGAAWAYEVLPE